MDINNAMQELLIEINKLAHKYEMSSSVPEDYFEPGMMENLEQYYGSYDEINNKIIFKTDVKGLRYDGRTPRLGKMSIGDSVMIIREESNIYNPNNFMVNTTDGKSLGNMPAELCNAIAPLYDSEYLTIEKSTISYLEKIQDRSRYAKQGVLFIEIELQLKKHKTNADNAHLLNEDFESKKICGINFCGQYFKTKTWQNALVTICKNLYELDPDKFAEMLYNSSFGGTKNYYFTKEPVYAADKRLRNTIVPGTDIYVLTNMSANLIVKFIKQLLKFYKIKLNDCVIYLRDDYTEL